LGSINAPNREIECRIDMHGRGIDKQDAIILKGRGLFHLSQKRAVATKSKGSMLISGIVGTSRADCAVH